jgi:hypothetical protein
MTDLDRLRYPIGKFERLTAPLDAATRRGLVKTIEDTPANFRALAGRLTDAELDTPYRPGGWTIRQVVHHVPDSHMNAYVRMKLAITQDAPKILTYEEQLWAELPDGRTGPAEMSLVLLEALHRRWVMFLNNLTDAQFVRTFVHPEWGAMTVEEAVALYAWHGRHHRSHIEQGLALITRAH